MKGLSTGIDIVEIGRVRDLYQKYGEKFLNRVLTSDEIRELEGKGKGFYQSLAGRIAAKEAIYKALNAFDSNIKISWKQVKIFNQANGVPSVILDGAMAGRSFTIRLSLSHSKIFAVATAVVFEDAN